MKSRLKLLGIVLLLVIAISSSTSGRASSPPPFPIEKCDSWLKDAEDAFTLPNKNTWSQLATACYLSHMVQR